MNKFRGFTLLESLVYLAVLAILLAFSVPLSHFFYQKNEVEVISAEVSNAILYARNMTLKTGTPMTLNPLPATGEWSDGMVLFVDNPTHHFFSDKDEIIHQWQWPYKGVRVEWHGFRSKDFLTFASLLKQSTTNGHFLIYNKQNYQKKLLVNRLGHVRYST